MNKYGFLQLLRIISLHFSKLINRWLVGSHELVFTFTVPRPSAYDTVKTVN